MFKSSRRRALKFATWVELLNTLGEMYFAFDELNVPLTLRSCRSRHGRRGAKRRIRCAPPKEAKVVCFPANWGSDKGLFMPVMILLPSVPWYSIIMHINVFLLYFYTPWRSFIQFPLIKAKQCCWLPHFRRSSPASSRDCRTESKRRMLPNIWTIARYFLLCVLMFTRVNESRREVRLQYDLECFRCKFAIHFLWAF